MVVKKGLQASACCTCIARWISGAVSVNSGAKFFKKAFAAFLLGFSVSAFAAVDVLISTFTDSPDPAPRGGIITYTITISNNGSDPASNVTATIPLPLTTTYEGATIAGGTCPATGTVIAGSNIVCNLTGNLAGGASRTFTIEIATTAATGSTINLSATAGTSSPESNTGNNTETQNTTINNGADLRIDSVSGSPDPVLGGGNITWAISGSNQGPNNATNSSISVTLPASLTFQSGSGGGYSCSAAGQVVTCTGPALANGATFSGLNLVTKVTGASSGNVQITPLISSTVGDPQPNNNTGNGSVTINAGSDLRITQNTPLPSPGRSNQDVTFVLQATNLGTSDATNGVTVTYQLPTGFTFVSGTPAGTNWGACTVDGSNLVTCVNSGNFATGRTDNITIVATAPTVTSVQNYPGLTATISHNAGNPSDPDLTNNISTLSLNISPDGAGLSITKSRSPNPVAEGQNITSTLRVNNQGPTAAAASTIQVTDTFTTADETFISASGTNWSCAAPVVAATTTVVCTYTAALANGANTQPLTVITQSVVKGFAYTSTNNAGVACTSGTCWYPVPTASASVSVTQLTNSVDLRIQKAATTASGNTTLESNETTLTYTLTVSNLTTAVSATDILIRDPIPGYRSDTPTPTPIVTPNYTNGSTATFNCSVNASGLVECTQTAGVLNAGDTVVITIAVDRNLNDGTFTNTATVASTTQGDNSTANNSASVGVVIDPIADVAMVSKILTPSTSEAGTNVTYVLTFRNNGPSRAAGVTVTDAFTVAAGDPGFTVVSVTPVAWTSGTPSCTGLVPGTSYGPGVTTLTCTGTTLNSGEQRTVEMVIRPNWKTGQVAGVNWTIPNTATITTTTAESTTGSDNGNNSQSAMLTVTAADIDLLINNIDNVDPLGYDASSSGNNSQNDVIYTINVVNNGPSLATGVRFTYVITPPAGKTIRFLGDSATLGPPAGSICNNVGSQVTGPSTLTLTCIYTGTDSQLASGSAINRYLSIRMLSTPATGGDIHNSVATVFANETDRNPGNDSENEATTVRSDIAVNNLSLGGKVFSDINNNGVVNTGEPGIPNVVLTLSGNTSTGGDICLVIASCTTQTDAAGNYVFSGLPPSDAAGYTVTESQPAGFTDGKDQVGTLGSLAPSASPAGTVIPSGSDSLTVHLTATATGYNFGEIGVPAGSANLSGHVWLDLDHDRVLSGSTSIDVPQAGWTVELLQGGTLVDTKTTDSTGAYIFTGLTPGSGYEVRFRHPTTGLIYGQARPNEQGAAYTNGVANPTTNPAGASNTTGTLTGLTLNAGDNILEQSLPLDPAGVVYDAVTRAPVAGATVTITGPVGFNPATHIVGGVGSQTTGADGMYQFLLNPGAPAGIYTLTITTYPAGYVNAPSILIPVCTAILTVTNTSDPSLVQQNNSAPGLAVATHDPATCSNTTADGSFANGFGATTTRYYFNLDLDATSRNLVNNHIPIDPILGGAIRITKVTPLVNVSKGDLVPYVITVTSSQALAGITITDRMPPGFKYRSGSATRDGVAIEPTISGRDMAFLSQAFTAGQTVVYRLMLVVGTGVSEGEYINQAWALNAVAGTLVSNIASATVRISPDPTFDCSDIIGKVFDDKNANGYQDEGEPGIPNVRVVTARGLLITTDAEGRFHVTCADIPDSDHGANFVMKLDERTLPSGYRLTTENPRDVRVTRGKMVKLNFGATVHRVIRLDVNDAAFASGAANLSAEWKASLPAICERLAERPSVLRIAYDANTHDKALAKKRLSAIADEMRRLWKERLKEHPKDAPPYPLSIETSVEGQQ